jgi:dolichyl-phosphate-mannose-protein mannosyltransferase
LPTVTTPTLDKRDQPLVPLSRTADGRVVPPATERARRLGRLEDPFIGWSACIAVTLLALFLRLWKLGTPREFQFDETYYAKDAWSQVNHGYVRAYIDGDEANKMILQGDTMGAWKDEPSMVVHPELGKWLIAAGEKAFGMDPFGWRIASAIIGTLMVLVMCRLVRRLTGSTLLGCVAGLLLCFDGLHLVLSRLALLDIFLAFFLLLAVHFLVMDRDWTRAKMASVVEAGKAHDTWGPLRGLWFRPWRLAAGITFGLALGTKWTAIFPLAAFGIMVWLWDAGARRSFGVRWATLRSGVVDALPAFAHLVGAAFIVYVATWTGWLIHADEYEEHLGQTQYTQYVSKSEVCDGESLTGVVSDDTKKWPTKDQPDARGVGEVVQSLRSLWWYHKDVYTFHTNYLDCSTHTYASKPLGWLLLNRPVGVDAQLDIKPGQQGCDAAPGSDCLRQVILLGTPILWWGGILALLYAVFAWLGRRDWRFGIPVVGLLSTWLPWLSNDDRPIFLFYAIACLPFTVIALALTIGKLISGPPSGRRTAGVVVAGSFVVLVVVNFAWFWPIWTDGLLTHSEWLDRIWFKRWI